MNCAVRMNTLLMIWSSWMCRMIVQIILSLMNDHHSSVCFVEMMIFFFFPLQLFNWKREWKFAMKKVENRQKFTSQFWPCTFIDIDHERTFLTLTIFFFSCVPFACCIAIGWSHAYSFFFYHYVNEATGFGVSFNLDIWMIDLITCLIPCHWSVFWWFFFSSTKQMKTRSYLWKNASNNS